MWWVVAVFVVSLFYVLSMIPKPQTQKPAGIDEVNAPTAEEGREIPVLFGTREISGFNFVWYGNFRAIPIKTKAGKK